MLNYLYNMNLCSGKHVWLLLSCQKFSGNHGNEAGHLSSCTLTVWLPLEGKSLLHWFTASFTYMMKMCVWLCMHSILQLPTGVFRVCEQENMLKWSAGSGLGEKAEVFLHIHWGLCTKITQNTGCVFCFVCVRQWELPFFHPVVHYSASSMWLSNNTTEQCQCEITVLTCCSVN